MHAQMERRKFLGLAASSLILNTLGDGRTTVAQENVQQQPELQTTQATHRLILPGLASDGVMEQLPPVETYPWTKNELLFGPNAGFQQLIKDGGTIKIYIPPVLTLVTPDSYAGWNRLGMELIGRPYFESIDDPSLANINLIPSDTTWVNPVGGYNTPFNKVIIYANITNLTDVFNNHKAAHEYGHGLGVVDILGKNEYANHVNGTGGRKYVNPYFDKDGKYSGIMDYEDSMNPDVWYGRDDKNVLIVTGYA